MGDLWGEKSRKPIRISVKREVYKRAGGKCEKCKKVKLVPPDKKGSPAGQSKGHYHHTRAPHISPTAKSVNLLCPTCHDKYGHSTKKVRHRDWVEDYTETKIKRHNVVKTGTKRKPKTKRVAIRDDWSGEVISYRTVKVKQTPKKKAAKKPARKKTTKKKTTAKRKGASRKKPAAKKKTTRKRKK